MTNQDFFYQHEANQFKFFRIPTELFKPKWKKLSTEAKLLYGILLDRNSLSMQNNWFDDEGKVYIYYDREELKEMIQVGKDKLIEMFKQLQEFNLIHVKRQGQGKANRIYVKKFIETPKEKKVKTVEQEGNSQKSEKPTSGNLKNRLQKVEKIDTSYTKENKTKNSKTNNNNSEADINNIMTTKEKDKKIDEVSLAKINEYKVKIDNKLQLQNNDLSKTTVKKLIIEHSEEKIDKVLDNWNNLDYMKKENPVGVLISQLKDRIWQVTKQEATMQPNMQNFEQRECDTDYYKEIENKFSNSIQ